MRGGFVAAVDLGATNVRVAIANSDGEIEARRHFLMPQEPPEAVLSRISRTVDELVRGVWVGARIDALGIALPGMVDPEAGVVSSVANLQGWSDVPIAALMSGGSTTTPRRIIAMDNDANAAAVGEGWLGAARKLQTYVFIALGTGIGAGVVIDGKVRRGSHFLGGEIAYFSMSAEQVRTGGWTNNLESLVGGRALEEAARQVLGESAHAGDLFDAGATGHRQAVEAIGRLREYLAMAVVNICALVDPEMVIFGGGVMAAQSAVLLDDVREIVYRNTPVRVPIVLSELGEDAQLLGAARLAIEREGVIISNTGEER